MNLPRILRQLLNLRLLTDSFCDEFWQSDREDFPQVADDLHLCFVEIALTSACTGLLVGALVVLVALTL